MACVLAVAGTAPLRADTTWDGGGTDINVDSADNWSDNLNPGFAGSSVLIFAVGGSAANINISIGIGGLVFNSALAFGLNAGGGTITLGSEGITVGSGAGPITIDAPLALSEPQTWTNDSANLFTVSGAVTINATNRTLTIGGSGNTEITGAISGASGGNLFKTGTGTLRLTNTNSYAGLTTVTCGILEYGISNAIGAGGITVNGSAAIFDIKNYSDIVGTVIVDGGGTITGTSGVLASTDEFILKNGTVEIDLAGDAALRKTTGGAVSLATPTSYTGITTVEDGSLTANSTGALGHTSSIRIEGGTLVLKSAQNIVNDSTTVDLSGGTLRLDSAIDETVGALTLSGNSSIDLFGLGTGSVIRFADSSGSPAWTGTLSVYNWLQGGGTNTRIYFGTTSTGLSADQLSRIEGFSGSGTGSLGAATLASDGELIFSPIPEPGTAVILGLLGLFVAHRERRVLAALLFRAR